MIKFFRQIRKSLLMENKTSKPVQSTQSGRYFKYAIGEIVLVVIGILIALSINNWNSQRIQDAKALRLAVRLLAETERNIITLEEDKARTIISANSSLMILHLMTTDYTNLNERMVDSLMSGMYLTPSYDFNSAVLSQALSTGEVANFYSDSLKKLDIQPANSNRTCWTN